MNVHRLRRPALAALPLVVLTGCAVVREDAPAPRPGDRLPRRGDEIVACGQLFHTGTRVVLWNDPGGFDASAATPRFPAALGDADPNLLDPAPRHGTRSHGVPDDLLARVQDRGWTLAELRDVVDQLVLHYDVCGTARRCFELLHDRRQLSVHFLLDVDGTIYQTLDLKEKAWHATRANSRSVGIEIANIGAYGDPADPALLTWYARDGRGTLLTIPAQLAEAAGHQGATFRPARPERVTGEIQGRRLHQYDLTDPQYEALIRLTATLHRVFPEIALAAPRDGAGEVQSTALATAEFARFRGILAHWHVQPDKVDPGPAFDWERLLDGARRLAGEHP